MELTKENVVLLAAICTAVGALVGALAGALSSLCVAWITKKFDERRHLRELIFNAAIESWKQECAELSQRPHLEEYIVRMYSFYELFIEDKYKPSKTRRKLDAFGALVEAAKKRHVEQQQTAQHNKGLEPTAGQR